MQLISLDLENFRQHRSAAIEFRGGITGIIGRNGAGKTTLLEAISWALYGAAAVRGKNAGIRCRGSEANEPVEVRLNFSLDGQIYSVTRRLDAQGRPQGAALAINGAPSRSGFTEVTDSIAAILGMDYRAFFTSFFTAQKQLDFMSGMDGRERAESIGKMLGYERLTRARDRANQDRLALQHEVEGLERGLPDPEELKVRKTQAGGMLDVALSQEVAESARLVAAQGESERLAPLKAASERKARRNEELSRRSESCTGDVVRSQARLEQLTAEIEDLEKKLQEAAAHESSVAEYNEAEKEYRELAALQKHEAERQNISGQIEAARRDMEQLASLAKAAAPAKKSLAVAEQALADAETQMREAQSTLAAATEGWIAAKQRLATETEANSRSLEDIIARRNSIEHAGAEGVCPTCERPLGDELVRVLDGFDEQAAHQHARLVKLKDSAAAAQKEPTEVAAARSLCVILEKAAAERRREKEEAAGKLAEVASCEQALAAKQAHARELEQKLKQLPTGFDQRRFEELRQKGIDLRSKRDRVLQLEAELKRLPGLRIEWQDQEKTFATKSAEVAEVKKALGELAFSPTEHERVMSETGKAADALVAARIELERRRGEVKEAKAVLEAVKAEEESYASKQAELKEKRSRRLHLRALGEAFDALRLDLNSRIRPELEETASELLAGLTDGRYNLVEVDDNYESWIVDDGERKQIISGGEDDVLNLALRLAISQMIANRSGRPFSLLVLDEVFGSLDDSRRDNVMSLLTNLRGRFEQIILITHIESIHDAVDNCIWVNYDEERGISKLSDGKPVEISGFPSEIL